MRRVLYLLKPKFSGYIGLYAEENPGASVPGLVIVYSLELKCDTAAFFNKSLNSHNNKKQNKGMGERCI